MMLTGKKILLGVAGSIAAYKAAFLVRLLVKAGAEVRVVMTHAATEFIAPLTLATLSKHEVVSDFTADKDAGTWNNHVELGLWADVMLIAPATANTLAKMCTGVCDNPVTLKRTIHEPRASCVSNWSEIGPEVRASCQDDHFFLDHARSRRATPLHAGGLVYSA